jgi:hypothetical protein
MASSSYRNFKPGPGYNAAQDPNYYRALEEFRNKQLEERARASVRATDKRFIDKKSHLRRGLHDIKCFSALAVDSSFGDLLPASHTSAD